MVVDKNKTVRLVQDHRMKDIPGVGHRFIQAPFREGHQASNPQPGIEQRNPEGLMAEMCYLWSKDLKGGSWTIQFAE